MSLATKISLLVIVVVSGCVLFLRDPATAGFYPTCPLYYTTGLYCPGCDPYERKIKGNISYYHYLFSFCGLLMRGQKNKWAVINISQDSIKHEYTKNDPWDFWMKKQGPLQKKKTQGWQ